VPAHGLLCSIFGRYIAPLLLLLILAYGKRFGKLCRHFSIRFSSYHLPDDKSCHNRQSVLLHHPAVLLTVVKRPLKPCGRNGKDAGKNIIPYRRITEKSICSAASSAAVTAGARLSFSSKNINTVFATALINN